MPKPGEQPDWSDWWPAYRRVITECLGGNPLRPIQAKALLELRMLETRRHLVVSAPTNSGKSLIGYLALVEALEAGQRAVLLEPLRSLAQEKADELASLLNGAEEDRGAKVVLSTGDYRLEHEKFSDGPDEAGEVVVATPERLEAILRNPEHGAWAERIGCVVVDEAHLIGSPHRGPTLELLLASLLAGSRPPRIILLSATAGEPEHLRKWLEPCDLLVETVRTPPLSMEVWELGEAESADDLLLADLKGQLAEPDRAALIFVYRRSCVEKLARKLTNELGESVVGYHSGLSAQDRYAARQQFAEGGARVAVATTALALGVNLPVSHVYIRDTTFHGFGRVAVDELLQMAGRAGRGLCDGRAIAFVKPKDEWEAADLAEALREKKLRPLRSSFENLGRSWHGDDQGLEKASQLVASCLSRVGRNGTSAEELRGVLERTLAGPTLGAFVQPAMAWLQDSTRVLAYRGEDERHRLTVLGDRGVRSVLPLSYVAGCGQLVRDLLSIDPDDGQLGQWSSLDHLLVMNLLSDRNPGLRRFGEKLAEQVDGWHESRAQVDKSLLFRKWIAGARGASKADELLGSLGCEVDHRRPGLARKRGYEAMLRAIVLDERSRGASVTDLERRWALKNFAGVEESWRDVTLWLLAGQGRLFELRCFYHHLVEECGAGPERIGRVKRLTRAQRHHCFDLIERIKYCSPLGPLIRGLRTTQKGKARAVAGVGTIRQLERAGIRSMRQILGLSVDDLVELGVQRRFAGQIHTYVRRRAR